MIEIHLLNDSTVKVNKAELETKQTMVVCINSETREGLIIPFSNIKYIADGEKHEIQESK